MTEPLIWLPFEVADLPSGLRYEVVPEPGRRTPESVSQVEGYVLPYRFDSADLSFLDRAPRLRWVQSLTAGVEHLAGRIPPGTTLCNGRGIHAASTAELAVGLAIASLRGFPEFVRDQEREQWGEWRFWPALADSSVLIVGAGDIAEAIEARLLPFEVTVTKLGRTARDGVRAMSELPDLLPTVDVVILIVPLTDQTKALVDAEFLAAMKHGAVLVNVARGGVVDTHALVTALHEGRVRAALDVTDPEPPPPGHPLWSAPNLLLTPHIGGSSTAFQPRAERLIRDQARRFAAGEELANQV